MTTENKKIIAQFMARQKQYWDNYNTTVNTIMKEEFTKIQNQEQSTAENLLKGLDI